MFSSSKQFLSKQENERLHLAVKQSEQGTSGEIRVYIESKCSFMNPIDRAKELFLSLKMYQTIHRNAVLIYIAYQDRDFAIIGDKNIYQKTNDEFWNQHSKSLLRAFNNHNYIQGMEDVIRAVGNELRVHFPTHGETKNELPDEIIFGK
jgi:uncharacterized membrane protein